MDLHLLSALIAPLCLFSSLSVGGHPVSRGTRVLVNMWSIHHDPEHWDKPDLFNPGKKISDAPEDSKVSAMTPFPS